MPASFLLSSVQNLHRPWPGARGLCRSKAGLQRQRGLMPRRLCPREGHRAIASGQWILMVWKSPLWGVREGGAGSQAGRGCAVPLACRGLWIRTPGAGEGW